MQGWVVTNPEAYRHRLAISTYCHMESHKTTVWKVYVKTRPSIGV